MYKVAEIFDSAVPPRRLGAPWVGQLGTFRPLQRQQSGLLYKTSLKAPGSTALAWALPAALQAARDLASSSAFDQQIKRMKRSEVIGSSSATCETLGMHLLAFRCFTSVSGGPLQCGRKAACCVRAPACRSSPECMRAGAELLTRPQYLPGKAAFKTRCISHQFPTSRGSMDSSRATVWRGESIRCLQCSGGQLCMAAHDSGWSRPPSHGEAVPEAESARPPPECPTGVPELASPRLSALWLSACTTLEQAGGRMPCT